MANPRLVLAEPCTWILSSPKCLVDSAAKMAVLLAMNSKPVPFVQDGKILWPLDLNNHDAFTNSVQCTRRNVQRLMRQKAELVHTIQQVRSPAPSRQVAVAPRCQSIPLIQATPSRVSGYTRLPLCRDFVQGVPGPIDMRVSVDRQSLAGIQQLHQEFGASATSGQMLCAKLFLWLKRHCICEQSPVRKPAVADTGRGEAARRGKIPSLQAGERSKWVWSEMWKSVLRLRRSVSRVYSQGRRWVP